MHVLVSGRVQGVYFRAFTQKEAHRLGLTGTVRNLSDGRVEIVAEGPREKLETLLEKVKQGPPGASVGNCTVTWKEYEGNFRDFEIVWR